MIARTRRFAGLIVASVSLPLYASAFAPISTSVGRTHHSELHATESSPKSSESWMDVLKFDGQQPNFDVLKKAMQFTSEPGYKSFSLKDIPTDYYADDYIFRGPIVGPINRKDLVQTNTWFGLEKSFPDLDRQTFGFTVDPENPFRVLFFERWKATHSGDLSVQGLLVGPASGRRSISPVMPFSITFNPDGKIIYECLTTAVDRFEGNTNGKVAVFGLLETAGVSSDNNIGNSVLIFQQKLLRFFNGPGQVYSKEEDVPSWWKSKAVAAEKNDM